MGFMNTVSGRVRDLFRQDKERVAINMAKGSTTSTNPQSGFDVMQSYGFEVLSDYLKMEQDLLSRYIDYEECDELPEINTTLDIYADDATQVDSQLNRSVWVESKQKSVQNLLDNLLHKQLRMDEEIWEIARTLCKYGSDYEELLVTDAGVVGLNFLPPPTMRRIEGPRGELFGFVQDFRGRFGFCLAKGSRVWKANGLEEIQNFQGGETVLAYKEGKQVCLKVKKLHCNGKQRVFKLRTTHRELFLTEDHPVLVERPSGLREWVKVKNLKIVRQPNAKNNIDYTKSDKLVICTRMPPGEALGWEQIWKYNPFEAQWGMKGSPKELLLPEKPTEDFCRLFGFLLGDGWIDGTVGVGNLSESYTHTNHKGEAPDPEFKKRSGGKVCFARGVYPELNDLYDGLLKSLGLKVTLQNYEYQSCVNSILLVCLLDSLGWIQGAGNKRIPAWVYRMPEGHREAFLKGFIDADGWDTHTRIGTPGHHFEIANQALALDFKNLIDGLGYKSGRIGSRQRKPGTVIHNKKSGRSNTVKTQKRCYNLHYSETKFESPFVAENLASITYYEDTDVYDLEIEDDAHNFVADGAVVHNSPAEFQQLLAARSTIRQTSQSAYSPSMIPGRQGMERVSALEDWEVAHFRLRGKNRRSVYGHAVTEGARWIFKRLVLLEDAAMIYRLQRAPERYAFYVDVGDLPPAEALAYVNRVRQSFKKTKFFNATSGKMDFKFNPLPVVNNTSIPLLDGRTITIEEMAKEAKDGVKHWVYSVNPATGDLVPGEVSWVDKTRSMAPTVRVTFDDGGHADMAPDHPVMMKDRRFLNAEDLMPGHLVMPSEDLVVTGIAGYADSHPARVVVSKLFVADCDQYCMTVDKWHNFALSCRNAQNEVMPTGVFVKNSADEDFFIPSRKGQEGTKIQNLQAPNWQCLVGDTRIPLKDGSSPTIEELSKRTGFFWVHSVSADGKQVFGKGHSARVSHPDAELFEVMLSNNTSVKCTGNHPFRLLSGAWVLAENLVIGAELTPINSVLYGKGIQVVGVRKLTERAVVYDLTVDEHHNFAVEQGVIVHNSMVDIEYFRDKLFAALKVPKAYLAQDASTARNILSSTDVRFARTVLRVQRELRNGIGKMCRVHMMALNIDPYQLDYDICMTTPSSIFELAQLEVRNARADLANRMGNYVSLHWTLSNVFGFSDSDIEKTMMQRQEDAVRTAKDQTLAQLAAQQLQQQYAPAPPAGPPGAAGGPPGPQMSSMLPPALPALPGAVYGGRPMTEKELFHGQNREVEKRMTENLETLVKNDKGFTNQLMELRMMMDELKASKGSWNDDS